MVEPLLRAQTSTQTALAAKSKGWFTDVELKVL
jgi:hypothetical protein